MPHPRQAVPVRRERHRVHPPAAVQRVRELGHQMLEWHLVAPGRGGGLLLDVLDVGGEDAHLEARRARGQQAVVGVPVQRSHSRLDRLLDVLGDPPVVLCLEVADGDESVAGADGELVLLGRPAHARGSAVDAQQHQRVPPLAVRHQVPDVGVPVGRAGDDPVGAGRPVDAGHADVVLVELGHGAVPV